MQGVLKTWYKNVCDQIEVCVFSINHFHLVIRLQFDFHHRYQWCFIFPQRQIHLKKSVSVSYLCYFTSLLFTYIESDLLIWHTDDQSKWCAGKKLQFTLMFLFSVLNDWQTLHDQHIAAILWADVRVTLFGMELLKDWQCLTPQSILLVKFKEISGWQWG